MNDLNRSLDLVVKELYQNPLIVEYFRLKKAISDDEKLTKLDENIRIYQRKMCEKEKSHLDLSTEKELYEQAIKEFDSNPLINNFNKIKDEVNELLLEIKEILK